MPSFLINNIDFVAFFQFTIGGCCFFLAIVILFVLRSTDKDKFIKIICGIAVIIILAFLYGIIQKNQGSINISAGIFMGGIALTCLFPKESLVLPLIYTIGGLFVETHWNKSLIDLMEKTADKKIGEISIK